MKLSSFLLVVIVPVCTVAIIFDMILILFCLIFSSIPFSVIDTVSLVTGRASGL